MAGTVEDLIRVALGEVGNTEHPPNSNNTKYGIAYGMNGVSYCSIGVWWAFKAIGIDLKREVTPGYADCDTALAGYARRKWLVGIHSARRGDVLLFDMSASDGHGADHTGIVERNDGDHLATIEWNTSPSGQGSQTNGGGVFRKNRAWSTVKAVARIPLFGVTIPPAGPPQTPSSGIDWAGINAAIGFARLYATSPGFTALDGTNFNGVDRTNLAPGVVFIQTALNKFATERNSLALAVNVTGNYDGRTVDLVRLYQAFHGLNPTGVVDGPTFQVMYPNP